MAPRNTRRYTLRVGNKVSYVGITNNPARRASEHRRDGKRGQMRVEGPPVTREGAQTWEQKRIAAQRKRNGPRSLRNRT